MEFKDIKNFGLLSNVNGKIDNAARAGIYEDNINFCRERYDDADSACEYFFRCIMGKKKYNGVVIFEPVEKYVVLNNFKNYAKKAGMDTSILSDEEWAKVSTPSMY